MNVLMLLLGLALVLVIAHLVQTIVRDGLGSRPGPRSHESELGTWADRQLHR